MSPENKDRRFLSEHERLGAPDFTGTWQGEKYGGEGFFTMYILRKEPTVVRVQTSQVGEIKEDAEAIDGVIFDTIGLAVFTGLLKRDSASFTKIYSESARKRGGSSDKIFYSGNFDEKTGAYLGIFGFSDIKDAGKFSMVSGDKRRAPLKK
jgi:hypothetical protein